QHQPRTCLCDFCWPFDAHCCCDRAHLAFGGADPAALRPVRPPCGTLDYQETIRTISLHFGMAAGMKVEIVIVSEDMAVQGKRQVDGKEGTIGTTLVHKVAGALATKEFATRLSTSRRTPRPSAFIWTIATSLVPAVFASLANSEQENLLDTTLGTTLDSTDSHRVLDTTDSHRFDFTESYYLSTTLSSAWRPVKELSPSTSKPRRPSSYAVAEHIIAAEPDTAFYDTVATGGMYSTPLSLFDIVYDNFYGVITSFEGLDVIDSI
ncbi:hypothetical protein BC936DRAFT_148566, partial [Jimgerdemannia flammicorona]